MRTRRQHIRKPKTKRRIRFSGFALASMRSHQKSPQKNPKSSLPSSSKATKSTSCHETPTPTKPRPREAFVARNTEPLPTSDGRSGRRRKRTAEKRPRQPRRCNLANHEARRSAASSGFSSVRWLRAGGRRRLKRRRGRCGAASVPFQLRDPTNHKPK